MPAIFFTGFPGFLGSELLPRILQRGDDTAICIVQPKYRPLAEKRAAELVSQNPAFAGRIRLVDGDITRHIALEHEDIREIYHFAAVYDLTVSHDLGMKVNVDGTRHVVNLATRLPRFERLHYVSTCYVSGRHPGRFMEDDLERGQEFNNYYEETKYLAEIEVRTAMQDGLPATIYRPSIVVGDSTTGVTQKYDGPYFVIRWLMRQPRFAALMPVVGSTSRYRLNVVPRDYVIRAMDHLSARSDTVGRTYALADPDPMTVDEIIRAIAETTGRRVIRVPLPRPFAVWTLREIPGLGRFIGIPYAAVNYFVHPTDYDTTNAQRDLGAGGFHPPSLRDYLPRLVDFVRAHPEIGAAAMV